MIDTKQIQPTYSGSFTTNSAGARLFLTIPLLDNTTNLILVELHACDTAGNELENISCQTWYRNGAGVATLNGTEKGPAPSSLIAASTVVTDCVALAGLVNSVTSTFTTLGAAHLNVEWRAYVVTDSLQRAV